MFFTHDVCAFEAFKAERTNLGKSTEASKRSSVFVREIVSKPRRLPIRQKQGCLRGKLRRLFYTLTFHNNRVPPGNEARTRSNINAQPAN